MSKYKIITNITEFEELIHGCQTTKYCSIDYETSTNRYSEPDSFPTIMGIAFQPGYSMIMPLQHFDSPFKKNWKKYHRIFTDEVLANPEIVKVAWNLKYELKWGYKYNSFMKGRLFDGMLAKYILDEERPHDLKSFVDRMFPTYGGYEDEIGKLVRKHGWAGVPLEPLSKYCGLDCDLTLRGMIVMEPKLIKMGFYNLFRNLLMGLCVTLAEAEYRGYKVDRNYLNDLVDKYKVKIAQTEQDLKSLPPVVRYETKQAVKIRKLKIAELNAEIESIKKEDRKTKDRLIAHRMEKIKQFTEGKISDKDRYHGINFGSIKQIIDFLYTSKFGLRLPVIEYTKDKKTKKFTTTPSTSEATLERLKSKDESGFISKLLELRALEKLNSTYVQGMVPHLDSYDRIHTTFHIQGTVTGRLSSTEPNLQNIPRGTTASDIKTMFIPPPGYLILEVDYSQAELRVIAELAKDEAMIDIFKRNYNPHVATACKMNGGLHLYDKVKGIIKTADSMTAEEIAKPENKEYLFWAKQKKRGKSMNFSILYQQGPKEMAIELGCTEEEAKRFAAEWFAQYPGIERWIKNQHKTVKELGYVTNMFGRRRRLPDIWSDKFGFVSKAMRDAINAPIQGSAGDFTSYSEIVIRQYIREGKLPADLHMICTVHDSIEFYVRPHDIHKVVPIISKICENPETLKYFGFEMEHVRMKVAAEVGKHWAALTDYDPWTNYTTWV